MGIPLTTRAILGTVLLLAASAAPAQSMNGFDLSDASVPVNEILGGGPPRDGIPAIDKPRFIPAHRATFLTDRDRILGIRHNGIVRAYPLRILNWHEIVNDDFAGEPVVVSFCPLCGTGMAFSAAGGKATTFGVSGLLYNSDLLLYDRETESLWSQILGRAVTGRLRGESLRPLPVEHTTWSSWRERHPATEVLSTDTGFNRNYNRSPYAGYETSDGLMFPVAHRDRRYHPKERVIGIEFDGHSRVYPFSELARTDGIVTDEIRGTTIRIRFDKTHQSAQIFDEEDRLMPGVTGFWFAWMAFHPDSEVFTAK